MLNTQINKKKTKQEKKAQVFYFHKVTKKARLKAGEAMQPLRGKSAIITGSTSGIGLACARALAAAGANITLNGFGESSAIEKIQKEMEKEFSVKVIYSSADVGKSDELKAMVKQSMQAFENVDIIINNAGIQYVAPVVDFPEEKWESILRINLSSAFKLIQYTLPQMLENKWGRIINIASAHGLVASPFKSAYVAAKHGLVGLTKTVALETAETNITCNALCPGYVKTPLVEKQIPEQAKAYNMSEEQVIKEVLLKAQPNKRFIRPEDLAQLALFLCLPSGDSMTGEILSMDGGWTAH